MWLFNLLFSSLSHLWYVEVRISRSVSVSPLEFEITRVDCSSIQEDKDYPNQIVCLRSLICYFAVCIHVCPKKHCPWRGEWQDQRKCPNRNVTVPMLIHSIDVFMCTVYNLYFGDWIHWVDFPTSIKGRQLCVTSWSLSCTLSPFRNIYNVDPLKPPFI